MIATHLIPPHTTVAAKGDSEPADIAAAENRVFLLTLRITKVVEQESLDIAIHGSADGKTWDAKPLLTFPQKFYPEEQPLLLHLTGNTTVNFVRAHWEVNRWGRGSEAPMFELELGLCEVPAEILKEAAALHPQKQP